MADTGNRLIVSTSPHIYAAEDISTIMWNVNLALIPAGIAGLIVFGYYCLSVIAISVGTAVITEAVIQKLRGQEISINDGSAVVAGLLLAYVLPPTVPWYVPMVGSFFAIAIAKHTFGGLGNNIWNPALAARAFLQVAYPTSINAGWKLAGGYGIGFFHNIRVDAVTTATPLFKEAGGVTYSYASLFFGNVGGCIGETSVIALLIGGIYLVYKGYVDWRVPAFFIGTVFVMVLVLPAKISAVWAKDPIYHILAGGLMIGAFFMATDMVTTPLTKKGLVAFAVGAGILTTLIRFYTGYPEGVCYAILLMNTATPLIDRWAKPRLYGTSFEKTHKKK